MARWYERPQLGEPAGDPAVELRDETSATETLDSLAAWESEIEEWEQLTGERMADSIKLCVLESQAPKELSTYLRLHTQAEETFSTVKRKIQDYLQAIDQSGPVPMEVGFVVKKGKKGKGKQPKGGGKQNKGKDKQPQDKNQQPATSRDTAATAASGDTRSASAGRSRSTI